MDDFWESVKAEWSKLPEERQRELFVWWTEPSNISTGPKPISTGPEPKATARTNPPQVTVSDPFFSEVLGYSNITIPPSNDYGTVADTVCPHCSKPISIYVVKS